MKNVSGLTVALQKILGISFVLMGRGGRVTTQEYLKAKLCSKSDNWGWGGDLGRDGEESCSLWFIQTLREPGSCRAGGPGGAHKGLPWPPHC